jgi:DNA-binding protein HU-beta
MNRTQLIEKVTEHTGVEKKAVAAVLAGLGEVVLASVAKGDSVMLPGIAKFTKVKRKARIGRNPATGAAVKIPAKTVAKVTALKLYKETVLGNAPAPKLQKAAPAAKPAAKAPARATAAAKAPAKTAAKAPARATAAAKAPAKTAAKTAAKAPARGRATAKPAAKPVVKVAAKAPAKAAAKPRAAKKA